MDRMPHRFAGHRLPGIVYAQPFELAVAGILLLLGAVMWFEPRFVPSSIGALSWPWALLFRCLVGAGGVFMLAGLFRGRHRWSYTAEMAGMVMGATVFGAYAAGLATGGNPAAIFAIIMNLLFSAACAIKARALWIEAHARLQLIRELPLPAETADDSGGN